jgi:hypothetical protein
MNTYPLTLGEHTTNGKTVTVRFHVSIHVLIHLQFEQGQVQTLLLDPPAAGEAIDLSIEIATSSRNKQT